MEKQQGQFYLFGQRRFLPFFATQFLGALNDNLFKNALLVIVVSGGVSATASDANFLTNLAAGLFILPYFLFSTTAGQLADKYDKAWLIKRIKFAEILIMLVGCYALLTKNVGMMMGVLFALGAQSAFFGPIKYAIIPQHLATHELMSGNAQVGMGTFVSILLGTLLGAWLVSYDQGTLLVGMLAMLVAVAGWLSSCQIPSAPADSDEIVLSFNPFTETLRNFRFAREDMSVFYCIVSISWFWLFGGSFLTQVPNFAVTVLQGHPTLISVLLGAFIVGVAIGSVLCAKLSKGQVEPGLIPIGAIGLTLFSTDIFFSSNAYQLANPTALDVLPLQFFTLTSALRVFFDLTAIGLFGGIFIVPLYALVQSRTASNKRARVLAANNVLNALFMVAGAAVGIVCLSVIQMSIPLFFLTVSLANLVFLCLLLWRVPEFKTRFLTWRIQ
ncbi:MAG: MFS transporter [Porticoccaceae bacterium]|nr:MFS transporter [Alphaproteobacteria bacterium]MDP4743946.1 MFS transporter [Porticoccaceae bacterium]MDP4752511.1 MFS transporter [Porticoccaceae bacterium]MDP4889807.1 MFS transporter [Porticoccaceae bacterium]MDP4986851.1 MFS transporter [Porticoccaceae bacterium]